MVRPGARNLITDVPGLRVGQAEDRLARTGVTVVLPDEPAGAAVDMRGGAPGTRETDALDPMSLAGRIDAVVLSGGSAFGLDSASGVMAWLSEQGRGFELRADLPRVPIVPDEQLGFRHLLGNERLRRGGSGDSPGRPRLVSAGNQRSRKRLLLLQRPAVDELSQPFLSNSVTVKR